MPDRQIAIEAFDEVSLAEALRATFSPAAQFEQAELDAMADFVLVNEGPTLLPRLIRYIEERRRNQARFTDPIERHPSPLTIIWGEDDPIAVRAMALRLGEARPDATLELLSGVGHYRWSRRPSASSPSSTRPSPRRADELPVSGRAFSAPGRDGGRGRPDLHRPVRPRRP